MKILTFANLLSRWNSHPHSCLISWPAFHYYSVGETSSLPFMPLKDNVTFCAYPNACRSAEGLRPLTSHGDGWHHLVPQHSPWANTEEWGTACVCQARPQLHFHRSTIVGGVPRLGKGCFENLADKAAWTRSLKKTTPCLSQGAQAGWWRSPHAPTVRKPVRWPFGQRS